MGFGARRLRHAASHGLRLEGKSLRHGSHSAASGKPKSSEIHFPGTVKVEAPERGDNSGANFKGEMRSDDGCPPAEGDACSRRDARKETLKLAESITGRCAQVEGN